jgi:hypothetical protein
MSEDKGYDIQYTTVKTWLNVNKSPTVYFRDGDTKLPSSNIHLRKLFDAHLFQVGMRWFIELRGL